MNYISEYDDLKFEAEMLKSIAFGIVVPFGFFVMQIFTHEMNLSNIDTTQLGGAIFSLISFLTCIYLSHDTMACRERILKRLHNRRTI